MSEWEGIVIIAMGEVAVSSLKNSNLGYFINNT